MLAELPLGDARLLGLGMVFTALLIPVLGCSKSGSTNTVPNFSTDATSGQVSTNSSPTSAAPQAPDTRTARQFPLESTAHDAGWRYQNRPEGHKLADLLPPAGSNSPVVDQTGSAPTNESLIQSAGIRKLVGRHVVIYTDLATDPAVDQLPLVFDQAVLQWAEYFAVDPQATSEWQVVGHVISDKEKFLSTALLPRDLPPFLHGYQRGHRFWVYDQPSAYYRRHLLLHEGTHAFMRRFLGSAGPPWYMEGIAELLGTHRWVDDRLTIACMPRHREEVPYWGRIKVVRDQVKQNRAQTLSTIMIQERDAFLRVDAYGWSWAAATFLDGHPRYRDRFRKLDAVVEDPQFSKIVRDRFADDWDQLTEEWQLFVMNLDYGYDLAREAIVFAANRSSHELEDPVTLRTDRGWQSSGLRLEAGVEYVVSAAGRYVVADESEPWWCEPNGVTIRYHQGRPLGMLLYAIRPNERRAGMTALARPGEIGMRRIITPRHAGTLFLRINDSPAELADNEGSVTVQITRR